MQMMTESKSKSDSAIRVYLIEDQSLIRAAVRGLVNQRENIVVVGECGDARAGIEEVRGLKPDVVLLDISMPGLSGIDAISRLQDASPNTKVVMLTHHEGHTFVEQSLRAGAQGYLSKHSDEAELALAVESVHRGDPYVSPRVAGGLLSYFRTASADDPTVTNQLGSLTAREREVFQLLAIGKSNKNVSSELGVSLGTAKKHRENLQRKLGCHSAAELARLAIREGLLSD